MSCTETKDEEQRTPLSYAAENGHEDIVEILIEKGADINTSDKDKFSALHYAVDNEHKNIVETFLSEGANVNAKDKNGYTSLYYAIWNSNTDMVNLLVSHNADVNISAPSASSTNPKPKANHSLNRQKPRETQANSSLNSNNP